MLDVKSVSLLLHLPSEPLRKKLPCSTINASQIHCCNVYSDHIFAKLQLFYLMIGHKGRQLPKSVSSNTGPALGFTTFGIFMITV